MMIQSRGLAIIKLIEPNRAKRKKLEELQAIYHQAVDVGVQAISKATLRRSGDIHALVYPLARQSGLPSMYARLVINEIAALARKIHRKGHFVVKRRGGLGLPANAYRLINKHGHWAIRMSLGERTGLLWLPLYVPEKLSHRLEQAGGDARLFQREGAWYAALPFHRQAEVVALKPAVKPSVVGVDLGIARLVTAFAEGKVLIVRGAKPVQHRKHLIVHQQKASQRQSSRQAARLKLQEQRWIGSVNHNIASRLVKMALNRPHPVIALENLDGLLYRKHRSQRFSQMRREWDFRHLVDLITYKAHEKGIRVVFVDPRGTSISCPRCGLIMAENASITGRFHCQECGYTSISDIVAARNIATRFDQA